MRDWFWKTKRSNCKIITKKLSNKLLMRLTRKEQTCKRNYPKTKTQFRIKILKPKVMLQSSIKKSQVRSKNKLKLKNKKRTMKLLYKTYKSKMRS